MVWLAAVVFLGVVMQSLARLQRYLVFIVVWLGVVLMHVVTSVP